MEKSECVNKERQQFLSEQLKAKSGKLTEYPRLTLRSVIER